MPKESRKKGEDDEQMVEYREFDPAWVRFDDTILLLGPRKGGKTVAAREILLGQNKPPRGMIQVGSPEGLKTWTDNLPILFLHESDTIDQPFFERWMSEQKAKVTEIEIEVKRRKAKWLEKSNAKLDAAMKKEHKALIDKSEEEKWSNSKIARRQAKLKAKYDRLAETESDRLQAKKDALYDRMVLPESCFCGFDDLGEEKKGVMDHKTLKKLMNTGRHYGALVFVIAQYAKHLGSACRGGINWLFLWPGSLSTSDTKKVFEDYIPGTMLTRKAAMRTFKAITDKDSRNCMVVWRSNPNSKRPEDCIFYWNPIKALGRRRGVTNMFGDPNFKLYSDLFYNGKEGYIQKIPDRHQPIPPIVAPAAAAAPTLTVATEPAEERKKIIESFGKKEVNEPPSVKVEKMAYKQAVNRWKKAEHKKKRQLTSGTTTMYTAAGTSISGTSMTTPLPIPTLSSAVIGGPPPVV